MTDQAILVTDIVVHVLWFGFILSILASGLWVARDLLRDIGADLRDVLREAADILTGGWIEGDHTKQQRAAKIARIERELGIGPEAEIARIDRELGIGPVAGDRISLQGITTAQAAERMAQVGRTLSPEQQRMTVAPMASSYDGFRGATLEESALRWLRYGGPLREPPPMLLSQQSLRSMRDEQERRERMQRGVDEVRRQLRLNDWRADQRVRCRARRRRQ